MRCGCWLEHEGATVFGNTIDVSEGGLFLRTALPVALGCQVLVTLSLPGGSEPLVAEGEVVHRVAPEEGDRPGLGVRFVSITRGRASLLHFLGAQPPPADAEAG